MAPKGCRWQTQYASKSNRKEEVMGEIVVEVKLGIEKRGYRGESKRRGDSR